jgi:hypothetical protein
MHMPRSFRRIVGIPLAAGAIAGVLGLLPPAAARASSHSDAPLIKLDPEANLTDVYAFIGTKYNDPSNTKVLNVVVDVHPFIEPGDGVTYDKFADDAMYDINIANPKTGAVITTYHFQFSSTNSGYKNLDTILSYGRGTTIGAIHDIGDSSQNYTQTYTVTQEAASNGSTVTLGSGTCPPPNVGARTTPDYNDTTGGSVEANADYGRAVSGATTAAGLDRYTKEAISTLSGGTVVFAGERDDSFFADTPGIFDLLDPRILMGAGGLGQAGGGVDGFKGYNVLTFAIQIPVSQLPSLSYSDAFAGTSTGVGVFASVSRPRVTLRLTSGKPVSSGPWIEVNRLGNPLFNEVLVALRDKDRYNQTMPINDADPTLGYSKYALTPELPVLLNAVFGTNFATTNRKDLVAVFIPDVLRVNTTTGPVPLAGQSGFNRLGFIGGDTVPGTTGGGALPAGTVNSGWPNGRRLGDDVVDVALTAVASGPSYSTVTVVGDDVPANDVAFNTVFPYAATPNSGPRNSKDDGPNVGF